MTQDIREFFNNKKVLVTGHTGFKGIWLTKVLVSFGADVVGYSLENHPTINLYNSSGISEKIQSVIGDIRDFDKLYKVFRETSPEIVFHLAAQPLVIESYNNPVNTYEVNVMGTVNILECIRKTESVKSFLNVTTDKVYENNEWDWGYRENDRLNGFDPYSNSKSCSELITDSYIKSFFNEREIAISTARAGNVIGGGDFSPNRIIPDCIRAVSNNETIVVRNPRSIRPYQHVLDPIYAYMLIAMKQHDDRSNMGFYNVGPDDKDCVTTETLVNLFCDRWGPEAIWMSKNIEGPHEAKFLKLDCSKIKNKLEWEPKLSIDNAVAMSIEWSKAYEANEDITEIMDKQIKNVFSR